jgi:hypothetical protein
VSVQVVATSACSSVVLAAVPGSTDDTVIVVVDVVPITDSPTSNIYAVPVCFSGDVVCRSFPASATTARGAHSD